MPWDHEECKRVEVFDSTAEGSVDDKFLDDFPADLEAQEILLRLSEDALLPAPPQGHVFSVLLTPAGKKYRRTDKVPNCTKVKIATRPLPPVAAPMLAGQTTILTQTAHTCQNLMLLLTHLSSFISCLRSLYHHIESRPMRPPVFLLSPLFPRVPSCCVFLFSTAAGECDVLPRIRSSCIIAASNMHVRTAAKAK
jgi:hypothetical protein